MVGVTRALVILVVLASIAGCAGRADRTDTAVLTIATDRGAVTLRVEVADEPAERARGLSGRESLPADAGMAFLWDEPVRARFWMKDTRIPLQIAFWDERGRILAILDMEPCRASPCPTYGPDRPFLGAAEANTGWFTEHGVAVGDRVRLGRSDDG
ncbi:hypothetical protein HRbin12_00106 [bacterium HR12]|nr:hypothetical protein HRbin12_00106 [bacterium HR12]